jgi:hypothetical protein
MFTEKKKYPATITSCGVGDKDGVAQPFVKFELTNEAGAKAPYTWYMSTVSEKSISFAATALVKIGFMGNDFKDLEKGVTIFAPQKLNVELEFGKKADGTLSDKLRVKWVNADRAPEKYTGTMPSQVGLFTKIKAELGVKKTAATTATKSPSDW